jgi:hypothetical protein
MRIYHLTGSTTILGLAIAALLAPQPASALTLDFNFSFSAINGSVEGIIRGLAEGATTLPASIEVTKATGGFGGIGQYIYTPNPLIPDTGFFVSNGQIDANTADWTGSAILDLGGGVSGDARLVFNGDRTPPSAPWYASLQVQRSDNQIPLRITSDDPVVFSAITHTPTQPQVPGPLPALGVAAAFGYSRKLRKRIQAGRIAMPHLSPT